LTHEEIATLLFINVNTCVRHVQDYLKRNKLDKASGGKASKLNSEQSTRFVSLVSAKVLTTVQNVIELCRKEFNIVYSRTGMIDWLNRHQFVYKKPPSCLPHCDEKAQLDFVNYYEKLKETIATSNGEKILLHMDAMHPTMKSKPAYGWIPKKNSVKIPENNSYTRLNIAGVLELSTMELIASHYEKMDSSSVMDFLQLVVFSYPAKEINIILDNGRIRRNGVPAAGVLRTSLS